MNDRERLDKEHLEKMKQIEIENYKHELREKENEARTIKKKKLSASKIVIAAMIILCLQIILYAEWVMFTLHDITALYVLIGVPATLSVSIWGYYSKSKAENMSGGIVYDATMMELKHEYNDTDENGCVG